MINRLRNFLPQHLSRKRQSCPRIIFIHSFFYPDHSAGSQILSDLAFYLSEKGKKVIIVTSRRCFDDPGVRLPVTEVFRGVEIIRIATSHFGRGSLIGRAVDYLSFYISATWMLWALVRPGDVLVAMTDPPLISVPVALLARLRGARLINWLQDVFPEVAGELGLRVGQGVVGKMITAVRDVSLRVARCNVVIGERMARVIARRGIPESKITVIQNWADDRAIVPIPKNENPLVGEWGLAERFVAAYSGNLGRAHEFRTILGAAERLMARANIVFLVIGGGAQFGKLKEEAAIRQLANMIFKPYQRRDRLPFSLGAADLHLVSLQARLEGLIVPSKFYGIAAAGRPVVFVGDPEGEIGQIVRQYDCGRTFREGDSEGLADCILWLASAPEEVNRMGQNARRAIDTAFSQSTAFSAWENVIGQAL
jgi:glycosyltransferase involved in cell wall biosynthesis